MVVTDGVRRSAQANRRHVGWRAAHTHTHLPHAFEAALDTTAVARADRRLVGALVVVTHADARADGDLLVERQRLAVRQDLRLVRPVLRVADAVARLLPLRRERERA
eukprot:5820686-Prymnesium_polylepis.2